MQKIDQVNSFSLCQTTTMTKKYMNIIFAQLQVTHVDTKRMFICFSRDLNIKKRLKIINLLRWRREHNLPRPQKVSAQKKKEAREAQAKIILSASYQKWTSNCVSTCCCIIMFNSWASNFLKMFLPYQDLKWALYRVLRTFCWWWEK